jgi:hypothetical protein
LVELAFGVPNIFGRLAIGFLQQEEIVVGTILFNRSQSYRLTVREHPRSLTDQDVALVVVHVGDFHCAAGKAQFLPFPAGKKVNADELDLVAGLAGRYANDLARTAVLEDNIIAQL